MPQIRSSDITKLHALMMQANEQYEKEGYIIWADTLFMQVLRAKNTDSIVEYTKGDRDANGKIIFKQIGSDNDGI